MAHDGLDVNTSLASDGNETRSFESIASSSAANGYLPVPIAPGTKACFETGWRTFRIDGQDLSRFTGYGTGLLCGTLVAPDIDVLHPAAAAELVALAERMLGAAPRRTGLAPKTLFLYRTPRPFTKKCTRVFTIKDYGDANRVEVLAQGQQFVGYAIHPGTKLPYTWAGDDPLTVPVPKLIEVTEDQVVVFLTAADETLARYGTPKQAEHKNDGLNIGNACPLDIPELIATIRAGGGGWEDNVTKLVGRLIREGLDINMIVALLREQITLEDQKNVRTAKFWTESQTEWSLRKIYRSLKNKEARSAEASAKHADQHTEHADDYWYDAEVAHTSTHIPDDEQGIIDTFTDEGLALAFSDYNAESLAIVTN
jgi:hypothetical protein